LNQQSLQYQISPYLLPDKISDFTSKSLEELYLQVIVHRINGFINIFNKSSASLSEIFPGILGNTSTKAKSVTINKMFYAIEKKMILFWVKEQKLKYLMIQKV